MNVARVEVVIIFEGSGPESERRKVATFSRSEKLTQLVQDPGVVGALLRDEFDRDGEPTGRIEVPSGTPRR